MARSQFASIEIDFRNIQDEVIEFVKEHLDPEDVFGEEPLTKWARKFEPDEIFEENALQTWAENNGYVLGDN